METNGSEYMIIKVDTKNGRIVEPPEDEKGKKAEEVSLEAIDEIYRTDSGFQACCYDTSCPLQSRLHLHSNRWEIFQDLHVA